jgi:hypothetical protein
VLKICLLRDLPVPRLAGDEGWTSAAADVGSRCTECDYATG